MTERILIVDDDAAFRESVELLLASEQYEVLGASNAEAALARVEDTAVDVTVLANDTDPDGDPLSLVSVTDPPSGTAVVNPGDTITYTPDADFFGPDLRLHYRGSVRGECHRHGHHHRDTRERSTRGRR